MAACPLHLLCPPINDIEIAGIRVASTKSARNIGLIFDEVMSHEHQIQKICKSAFFHIRNLSRIRKCLNQKDIKTLVHAFITSKLDNCYSLLSGLPQYLLDKVQRVQNAAPCLVSGTRKYGSITLILKELHWLPVKQRITFKIRLLTYKVLYKLAHLLPDLNLNCKLICITKFLICDYLVIKFLFFFLP